MIVVMGVAAAPAGTVVAYVPGKSVGEMQKINTRRLVTGMMMVRHHRRDLHQSAKYQ